MITIKIFVPEYYSEFRCIADRCTDTCCAGWDVNFEPEDAEFYRSVKGSFGDRLRSSLAVDADGDNIFTLTEDRRCPFLNGRNLCDIYISLGEDALCPTCKLFPRFFDDFGSFREMGLGFGCPEAARIMLEQAKPLKLCEYGCTEDDFEVDNDFLDALIDIREKLFKILQNGLPLAGQIKSILSAAQEFQIETDGIEDTDSKSDFNSCVCLMSQMEYIDESRKNLYASLSDNGFDGKIYSDFADDFRKLLEYYIFRYALKAVYDGDLLTKIKYGVFACVITGRAYENKKVLTIEDRVNIMCGYSKEVEYSDINMNLLDEALYDSISAADLSEMF